MEDFKFFEDMWDTLEQEVSSFDSQSPFQDVIPSDAPSGPDSTESNPPGENNSLENLEPSSPSTEALESKPFDSMTLSERIEETKRYYQENPHNITFASSSRANKSTPFNFKVISKILITANILSKKGRVKEANRVFDLLNKTSSGQSFRLKTASSDRTIHISPENTSKVEITDNNNQTSIVQYSTIHEGLSTFLNI